MSEYSVFSKEQIMVGNYPKVCEELLKASKDEQIKHMLERHFVRRWF